jgi:hypothetical protein
MDSDEDSASSRDHQSPARGRQERKPEEEAALIVREVEEIDPETFSHRFFLTYELLGRFIYVRPPPIEN